MLDHTPRKLATERSAQARDKKIQTVKQLRFFHEAPYLNYARNALMLNHTTRRLATKRCNLKKSCFFIERPIEIMPQCTASRKNDPSAQPQAALKTPPGSITASYNIS